MSMSAYGKFYDKSLDNCYGTSLEPSTVHHTMTHSARNAKLSTSNPPQIIMAAW